MKNNKVFMAFASGKESTEAGVIKRYIGVAPSFVLAVNPNKAKMSEVLNITVEDEPNYVGEIDVNGTKVANARISFYLKPDPDKVGMEVSPINMALFIRNEYKYNKDKTKVQVIDKYGRTAWVTIAQAKQHEVPVYSNGPAKIDAGYRPAYVGEEELISFLKCYLNIPNVDVYNNKTGEWTTAANPSECEASLDNIPSYFKGDFTEIRNIIALQPNNKVKVLYGVRTTDEGKQYQAVFTQKFLKNNASNYSKLEQEVTDRKAAGAYSTTEFEVCDFKEYVVASTDLSTPAPEANDLPFGNSSDSPWGNL